MSMPAMRHHWTTVQVRALMDESRHWPRYELLGGELLVEGRWHANLKVNHGLWHRLILLVSK